MSNIDLSFKLEPIFTNGLAFYSAFIQRLVRDGNSHVFISTYNTSINGDFPETVSRVLTDIHGYATQIYLLVGTNPYHPQNHLIRATLSRYVLALSKLQIRLLKGVHMKTFFTPSFGYAGSLNLIHPTLDDLMVRLSSTQLPLVHSYFLRLWDKALPLGNVQTLNKTSSL